MFNKTLAVTALACALVLGAASPAVAAGDRDDRGRHGWDDRGRGHGPDRRDGRDDRRYGHGYQDGYRDARRHAPPPRVVVRHAPPPPPMMGHRMPPPPPYGWARGVDYRRHYQGPIYVVNDYQRYHLRQPPRGHRWVRDDRGNYLLVAIATGIIADLLLHH